MVYEQVVSGVGLGLDITLQRHVDLINKQSEFYNPWQYRVFSTYLLEGFIQVYSKLSEYFELKSIFYNMNQYIPLMFFRFLQNILILLIAYKYYRQLGVYSFLLIICGLILLGLSFSNANFASDLSFNTYFDVFFYLLAGYIIISNHNNYWIIMITFIAALNRETSAFIPFMLLIYQFDWKEKKIDYIKNTMLICITSFLSYIIVFIATRLIFGVPSYQGINNLSSPIDFFIFNVTFGSLYPELFGTLIILPILLIFYYKNISPILKKYIILIVPAWFLIHFFQSQAMETRLFLVPHALIFIPVFLLLIENEFKSTYLSRRHY